MILILCSFQRWTTLKLPRNSTHRTLQCRLLIHHKALVNRIKLGFPHLISNTQENFVPERQITDTIVIVQEVIHTKKRKRGAKGLMAIKIDFEKAYDRLCLSFVRDNLMHMNLPLLLIKLSRIVCPPHHLEFFGMLCLLPVPLLVVVYGKVTHCLHIYLLCAWKDFRKL